MFDDMPCAVDCAAVAVDAGEVVTDDDGELVAADGFYLSES